LVQFHPVRSPARNAAERAAAGAAPADLHRTTQGTSAKAHALFEWTSRIDDGAGRGCQPATSTSTAQIFLTSGTDTGVGSHDDVRHPPFRQTQRQHES
ncbi:hypothetical protein, partial [Microvirga aerophila]|uniref:hypothetical protein n=1 Tax=Microvirga aerophila TaxID=670291 RepID=UPI001AED94A2